MHRLLPIVNGCVAHICSQPTPRNWSPADWAEEIRQVALAAAWQALCDYDPTSGIPFEAFVYHRVMSAAHTYRRREYKFSSRCCPFPEPNHSSDAEPFANGDPPEVADPASIRPSDYADVRRRVAQLPPDRRFIIEQLFWHGRTEADLAATLHLSQPTLHRRKHSALHVLN